MPRGRKSELEVITVTQRLCSYILEVTQRSPKQYRMTVIPLLVNAAMDALSHMFLANEIYFEKGDEKTFDERIAFQREAMKDLKMLSYFSSLSVDKGILTMKQYKNIAEALTDAENLLGAWMNSDKRRIEKKQ